MRKKSLLAASVVLSGLMALCAVGCGETTPDDGSGGNHGGNGDDDPGQKPQTTVRQLLSDPEFQEGITVTGLRSQTMEQTYWRYSGTVNSKYDPSWTLGQYCDLSSTRQNYDSSVNDLSLGGLFDDPCGIEGKDGSLYTLTNRSGSKYIAVDPTAGSVTMNIDTRREYVDQATGNVVPRKSGEDWVHMILQQSTGIVYLYELESLDIELTFSFNSLEEFELNSIGASQFQWIFSVHDRGNELGDYMWFNVTIYDNRYPIFPGTQMFDGGKEDATGKFIYAPTGEQLFGGDFKGFEVGKDYKIAFDLKEYIHEAYETAKARGALPHATWESMAINGFNLGWEASSVAKVGVDIKDLSLRATEAAK